MASLNLLGQFIYAFNKYFLSKYCVLTTDWANIGNRMNETWFLLLAEDLPV